MKNQREQNDGKEDTNEHGERSRKLCFMLVFFIKFFYLKNTMFTQNFHQ